MMDGWADAAAVRHGLVLVLLAPCIAGDARGGLDAPNGGGMGDAPQARHARA